MRNKNYVFLIITLIISNIAFSQEFSKLSNDKKLSQFVIKPILPDDGLPSEAILSINQTQNGYIWASTYNGIVRYDGVNLEIFNVKNTPIMSSNLIMAETIDNNGDIWFGTYNGCLKNNGSFFELDKSLNELKQSNIESLEFDSKARLWIATTTNGLYTYANDNLLRVDVFNKFTESIVNDIEEDNNGTIWFGTDGGVLIYYDNAKFQIQKLNREVESINDIYTEQDKIWVATSQGIFLIENNKSKFIAELPSLNYSCILKDNKNNLWIGAQSGLYRYSLETNQLDSLQEKTGLPNNMITDITFDNDGNLWVGTYRSGFFQLIDGPFTTYSTTEGLSSNMITSICEIEPGKYLLVSDEGDFNIIENEKITNPSLDIPIPKARIKHLYKDSKNNYWLSTYGGLIKFTLNGDYKIYDIKHGFPDNLIRQVFEDSRNQIWVGTKTTGIYKLNSDGTFLNINIDKNLPSNYIMGIKENINNELIINTKGGLAFIKNDKVIKKRTVETGLPANFSFASYIDENNRYWISSNDGIIKIENDSIFLFNIENGLPDNTIFEIFEDKNGYFWMPGNKGVTCIKKQDLIDYEKGIINEIPYKIYDKSHGIKLPKFIGASKNYKDSQNNFWFYTIGGIIKVSPESVVSVKKSPQFIFKYLQLKDKKIYQDSILEVPPGNPRITINYTAIDFESSNKIKFRYKLIPFEKKWQYIGNERSVTYTNLSPKTYQFEIQSTNNEQEWTGKKQLIPIIIKPAWWQTWIFKAIVVLLLIGLLILIYKWRTYQVRKQNDELERMVRERTAVIENQKEELSMQAESLMKANTEITAKTKSLAEKNKMLEISNNNIKILSEIGQKITAYLSINKIVKTIFNQINILMDAPIFAIGLFNEKMNHLEFFGAFESDELKKIYPDHTDSLDSKNAISVACFKRNKPLLLSNFQEEKHQYIKENNNTEIKLLPNSAIYIPLNIQDKKIGVITVQSMKENQYTENHLNILKSIGNYASIALENAKSYKKIHEQKNYIEKINEMSQSSIRYALTIQKTILPNQDHLHSYFDFFILFKPRDIVSGDFYWFTHNNKITDYNQIFIAMVDCTGHGVPGAFMSIIGNQILNDIIKQKEIYEPKEILNILDKEVNRILKQDKGKNADGMDMIICRFDLHNNKNKVIFAGAKRPLFIYSNEDKNLSRIKTNIRTIGGIKGLTKKIPFEQKELDIKRKDIIYLMTDGYIDQHGSDRKSFGTKKLTKLLSKNIEYNMSKQKEILETTLNKFQKDEDQRDDITIIGLKIK